jgi:hypothetical protein
LLKQLYEVKKGGDMHKCFRLLKTGMLLSLLLALWGCGSNEIGGGSDQGTSTSGPVSISTDHATYAPGDTIAVSITNHLQTSIYAFDTRASCTILDLQVQVNGAWQNTQVARCALGRMALLVEIPAGKAYNTTIHAGTPGVSSAGFPAGMYRLVLKYSMSPSGIAQTNRQTTTTVYSASIAVAGS